MKRTTIATTLLAALLGTVASAQQAVTDPVGFVSVTVLANSDSMLAVPLNRAAEFKGTISSIAGNVITVSGTPGWTANQFVQALPSQTKTYAVQFASGTKEGMTGSITANTTNTITVSLPSGDDFTGVVAGDQLDIMPFWTPSTLFSGTVAVGFELQGFVTASGINAGSTEIYTHAGSNTWEDGINGGDTTHSPLPFGIALLARNNSASNATLSMVGSVPMSASRIRLTAPANTEQDIAFGFMSPIPEALSAAPSGSANRLGFPVAIGDQIQGFDNSATGINKGAAEIYVWNGSAWEDGINGGDIDSTVTLKPGFGYLYRKAPSVGGVNVVWTRLPSYLQ
jgi:uncharacterized protein (TIGR02597 family)